jgi:hypothetical protein
MSFAELLAEIPRLTPEQRRELIRQVCSLDARSNSGPAAAGFQMKRMHGRLVLTAPRVIRQAEVGAILADFP